MWGFPLRKENHRREREKERERVNRLQNDPELFRLHSCHFKYKNKSQPSFCPWLVRPGAHILEGQAASGGIPATRPRGSHPAPSISPRPGRYRRCRQPSDTMAVSQGPAFPLLLNKMHVYKHEMPWRLAIQRRGAGEPHPPGLHTGKERSPHCSLVLLPISGEKNV